MLSRLRTRSNIKTALHYNEQKVEKGKAERIGAENFLKDHDQLTKEEILTRFRQRSSFNERLHDHGAHITLNFGTRESLDNTKLSAIANTYMSRMGFEDEPYVVYRHRDAGHTHLHVVATTVRADGSWIRLEPVDYRRSHEVCRQLENEFFLERNRRHTQADSESFKVGAAQRVVYGDPGLARAISDVVNTVFPHYKYTSLDEYNAILRQYNVRANPGKEDSRLRSKADYNIMLSMKMETGSGYR